MLAKPAFHDHDDLPPALGDPSDYPAGSSADRPASRPTAFLGDLAWLASGLLAAACLLGSPGCVATGPAVSAKVDLGVKETGLVAHVGGGAGAGEVTGSISLEIKWPSK